MDGRYCACSMGCASQVRWRLLIVPGGVNGKPVFRGRTCETERDGRAREGALHNRSPGLRPGNEARPKVCGRAGGRHKAWPSAYGSAGGSSLRVGGGARGRLGEGKAIDQSFISGPETR